jgi:chromosome partitioning protein
VEQDIRQHFGQEVFATVIPRNVKLSEAPSHGKPVILYDISSTGAAAYMDVARQLLRKHGSREENARSATTATFRNAKDAPSLT